MDPPTPTKDYYSILGVPRNSSDEAIKARYRQLAMDLHPDRCAAGDVASVERFKTISEAYRVLVDSGQRRILDDYLEGRRFAGARLRGDEGFLDRLAGVRRPKPPPGSRRGGGASSKAFRFIEIALSPRVLVMGLGVGFMSYIAFGPRDENFDHTEGMLVPAWYNQRTKRWETPAPWDPGYRAAESKHHARVSKYHVFESTPPGAEGEGRGGEGREGGSSIGKG